jgi:hypothetical protein
VSHIITRSWIGLGLVGRARLAATNPAAFEPNLASSLNNLGMMLSGLGRRVARRSLTSGLPQNGT